MGLCASVTLSVSPAILILALQCCCYPYSKGEGKGTAKSLIKADKIEQVSELRIETRSPEVSLLGTFPLPSSTESLFSPGAGLWKSGQHADRFSFPRRKSSFTGSLCRGSQPARAAEVFCSSHRTPQNPAIRPVQLWRGWQSTGTAHYLKTGSHNMLVRTSETNLWNGPWWELDWPELPPENVPTPPLHPVCVYWRENKSSFKFCTCICTVTFLAVTSWLYLKLVIKCSSG